jgi:ribose 5-phosphate isomerase B
MASEKVAIGADHAGLRLKTLLIEELEKMGCEALDLGTNSPESVDYPDYAEAVAKALEDGEAARGILICGTGIGMSIAANRHPNIRAAVCHDVSSARLARQHNDANILALGGRVTGDEVAKDCLRVFLNTAFEGGRHAHRVAKLG